MRQHGHTFKSTAAVAVEVKDDIAHGCLLVDGEVETDVDSFCGETSAVADVGSK